VDISGDVGDHVRHVWQLDEYGERDDWALCDGYHNGPYCTACLVAFCKHCSPIVLTADNCPGDE
jgi:hypothetical protein